MRWSALVLLAAAACASTVPNRDPTGEAFPRVEGEALDRTARVVPDDLKKPAVVLVGYVQDAQFDIDRWLLGLVQLGTPVDLAELPTIRGFVPSLIAPRIDEGMRSGIPSEDWGSVVTIYDDADRIVEFTGNEKPRNARVLLIGEDGTVAWFFDRGYSVSALKSLDEAARKLAGGE